MAKSFLLAVVIYGCFYGISPILFTGLPKEIEQSLWDLSLVIGLKINGTAVIWSLYLKYSSRVKNTYLS